VREVEGDFNRRDAVRLLSLDGRELARGLTAMDSDELQERKGQRGLVVHRDQLVITPGANRS
jgi:glutamate 5-kinase